MTAQHTKDLRTTSGAFNPLWPLIVKMDEALITVQYTT
jgi:hypothetical protein